MRVGKMAFTFLWALGLGGFFPAPRLMAQTVSSLEQYLRTEKTLSGLQQVLDKAARLPADIHYRPLLERELDFGYHQTYYEGRLEGADFTLIVIHREDQVVLAHWEGTGRRQRDWIHDEAGFHTYWQQHQGFYQSDLSENAFTTQLGGHYIFGLRCGFAGTYISGEGQQLGQALEKKNPAPLQAWLRSPNVELQTYGAIGLLELKHQGATLDLTDLRIIEHLLSRNSPVYTCAGCLVGVVQPFLDIVGVP